MNDDKPTKPVRVSLAEHHAELRAQGVSAVKHCAFICIMCGTVQSSRSFERLEVDGGNYVGFSCIGRRTGAGAPPPKRGKQIGCNWTLGGLLQFANRFVKTADGKEIPSFEIATPEEAQKLERLDGEPFVSDQFTK